MSSFFVSCSLLCGSDVDDDKDESLQELLSSPLLLEDEEEEDDDMSSISTMVHATQSEIFLLMSFSSSRSDGAELAWRARFSNHSTTLARDGSFAAKIFLISPKSFL